MSQVAHQSEACPRFCSMKRLQTEGRVFLLPPGWDANPSQSNPRHYVRWYPFTCEEVGIVRVNVLPKNTIQHNV